ncbi:glycosyltransferase family 2 protein [Hymenobacter sp. HD11105]
MKKISIVIPVYNRKADLPRCLDSTRSRTAHYEVIVVDDASTDGSYELLQTMDIPHMKLFRNPENKGVNYTRNRGIEQASGDYILFLDSDDKLFPNGLDTVAQHVEENAPVKHFLFFVSSNENKAATAPYTTRYEEWLTESVYGDFTHVIERQTLLQFPFFEQFRAYENLNWLRIIKATEPQLVVPQTVTWVDLDRTDNLTKTLRLKSVAAIAGKFQYLQVYFGLYGADLYALAPAQYQAKFRHALLLGIAANQKEEVRALLAASPLPGKALYKAAVALTPAAALRTLITFK